MAGLLKIADKCDIDWLETLKAFQNSNSWLELEPFAEGSVKSDKKGDLKCLFDQITLIFISKICGNRCFRPLPPMLGSGYSLDLYKMYLFIRKYGGYESVFHNGLWFFLVQEFGLSSLFGTSLKLGSGGKVWSSMDQLVSDSSVVSELCDTNRNQCQNNQVRSLVQLNGIDGKMAVVDKCDIGSKSQGNDDACNRKRKRDYISQSFNWLKKVAKDPCDQVIGTLPEFSKWKYFGTEYPWKQLLLVRQAMMVKRHGKSNVEAIWKKKNMMHPSMYEDDSRFSERVASPKMSQAALSLENPQAQSCSKLASSNTKSELEKSLAGLWITKHKHKKIPVGVDSQAEVPEWTEEASDIDSKWLGTRIWPQEKGVNIERDPIGFGRRDECSCEFKGSFECVRLHVSENRIRLKHELGMAFYHWNIDKMGEEVALSWNKSEELKFEAIVKSYPPSQDKCFYKELKNYFHDKKREQLVGYYFNVFLLRQRALQNRSTPVEISSDGEDS